LGQLGEMSLPGTLELLRDPNPETRRCAADSLGEIRSPAAIGPLANALAHDQESVQLWAALSLAKIGPAALPVLHAAAIQLDDRISVLATDAILKIGSHLSVPLLRRVLRSGSDAGRECVLNFGSPLILDLIPEVKLLCEAENPKVSTAACRAHEAALAKVSRLGE
jgi:hypothetical protein